MSIRDIIRRRKEDVPVVASKRREEDGLLSFQRDVNRLFDEFFSGTGLEPFRGTGEEWGAFNPQVNLSETDKEIRVQVELPGMDEKDVTVELDGDVLVVRGEKKAEHEEKGRNWHRIERSYGSFHRAIPLPATPEAGKVKARFKKGVLDVALPKSAADQKRAKTIEVTAE